MNSLPTAEDFATLSASFAEKKQKDAGIGTYMEKSLHNMLKYLFCPDGNCHEQKIGPFVADAVADRWIFEVQTGSFFPLKKKIQYYLSETDQNICIIYPTVEEKRVFWIDPETGEMQKPRNYHAKHARWKLLRELYYLCDILDFSRISIVCPRLAVDDYRMLDGWGPDKKRRSTKVERVPSALLGYRVFENKQDLRQLVPPDLPDTFDAAAFSRLTRLSRLSLSAALKAMQRLGLATLVGKEKNKNIYQKESVSKV